MLHRDFHYWKLVSDASTRLNVNRCSLTEMKLDGRIYNFIRFKTYLKDPTYLRKIK